MAQGLVSARKLLTRLRMREPENARLLSQLLGRPDWERALQRLLERHGSWLNLYREGPERWVDVLGEPARHQLEALSLLLSRWLAPSALSPVIDGPQAVLEHLGPLIRTSEQESFWVIMLDGRSQLIAAEEVSKGILNACLIHPREVFAPAVRARAGSVVVVHNHPSGDPSPSQDDEILTDRLAEVGAVLGIPLVDHLVVGWAGVISIGSRFGAEAEAI